MAPGRSDILLQPSMRGTMGVSPLFGLGLPNLCSSRLLPCSTVTSARNNWTLPFCLLSLHVNPWASRPNLPLQCRRPPRPFRRILPTVGVTLRLSSAASDIPLFPLPRPHSPVSPSPVEDIVKFQRRKLRAPPVALMPILKFRPSKRPTVRTRPRVLPARLTPKKTRVSGPPALVVRNAIPPPLAVKAARCRNATPSSSRTGAKIGTVTGAKNGTLLLRIDPAHSPPFFDFICFPEQEG